MAYRVHAAVDHVQSAALDAVVDSSRADPLLHQLPPRDHAMLSVGERRDRPVNSTNPILTPYDGVNVGFVRHAPSVTAALARAVLEASRIRRRKRSTSPLYVHFRMNRSRGIEGEPRHDRCGAERRSYITGADRPTLTSIARLSRAWAWSRARRACRRAGRAGPRQGRAPAPGCRGRAGSPCRPPCSGRRR